MIASVHIANVGARSATSIVRKTPKPAQVRGLRKANVALTAPLSRKLLGDPDLGRAVLVAFWDDDTAARRLPRRPSTRREARRRLARAARSVTRVRLVARAPARHAHELRRRARRSRRRVHAGSASAQPDPALPQGQRQGRGARRSTRPGMIWATGLAPRRSSRPARCGSRRVRFDLRVRPRGSCPSRRDRREREEGVPSRAGVHPVRAVRLGRPPRRPQPVGRSVDAGAAG